MTALAIAAPLVLAGERDLLHFPSADEVRMQPISKAENEAGWPFSADSGNLTCVWSGGRRIVFFFEDRPGNEDEVAHPRVVIVSVNPFELTIGNIANAELFLPAAGVAELIVRVAPFVDLGQRLCDQPPGAIVRHGEL